MASTKGKRAYNRGAFGSPSRGLDLAGKRIVMLASLAVGIAAIAVLVVQSAAGTSAVSVPPRVVVLNDLSASVTVTKCVPACGGTYDAIELPAGQSASRRLRLTELGWWGVTIPPDRLVGCINIIKQDEFLRLTTALSACPRPS